MNHHRRHSGYSLIELLTVMLLMSIMATLGAPHFLGWLRQYRLRAAATVMVNHFRATRLLAIHTGVPHQIQLRAADSGNYYQVVSDPYGPNAAVVESIGRVPVGKRFGGVRLVKAPGGITFSPRGTSHNRTVILENGAGMQIKIITNTRGRVRREDLLYASRT